MVVTCILPEKIKDYDNSKKKIHRFCVYNSVVFGIFTVLYDCLVCLLSENLASPSKDFPSPSPYILQSTLGLCGFARSGCFHIREVTRMTSWVWLL